MMELSCLWKRLVGQLVVWLSEGQIYRVVWVCWDLLMLFSNFIYPVDGRDI